MDAPTVICSSVEELACATTAFTPSDYSAAYCILRNVVDSSSCPSDDLYDPDFDGSAVCEVPGIEVNLQSTGIAACTQSLSCLDPLAFCGYASVSDIPYGFDEYDVEFVAEVEGGILDAGDCPEGYTYYGDSCRKHVSRSPPTVQPTPTPEPSDEVDINEGVILFVKDSPACVFKKNPETKGPLNITNLDIASTGTGTKMFVMGVLSQLDDGIYTRVKLIKSSFDKKHPMMMKDSTRKAYRDSHIDKYYHHCQYPLTVDSHRVAGFIGMEEGKFSEMFPRKSQEQYIEFELPGFDSAAFLNYQRIRVEVSLASPSPTHLVPVHGYSKVVKQHH